MSKSTTRDNYFHIDYYGAHLIVIHIQSSSETS